MNFKKIRSISSYIFIVVIVVFAFVGILSIWDVFSNEVFTKALLSLSVLSVSYVLIVLTTLERENRFLFTENRNNIQNKKESKTSIGRILLYLFILWLVFGMISTFFSFIMMASR